MINMLSTDMPEELFEIERGIFSLDDQKPQPTNRLILAVQPFIGIPLDAKGMSKYLSALYDVGDCTEAARLYEIGIKLVIGLGEYPLVTLEEASRVESMAQLQRRFHRDSRICRLADSYIISVGEKQLKPDSNFPQQLSGFLAGFCVEQIDLIGICNQSVMDYLLKLPPAIVGGIEKKLRFIPDETLTMTPQKNPFYIKETPLLSY